MQGGSLSAEARSQQVTRVTIPGERGRVLDRNGKVLATSEDAADVIATPYQVENPGQTALRLHEVLGEPTADLLSSLADRSSGFAYLARKVDPGVASRVEKLHITGISTVPDSKRIYPQGDLASQLIGAVGTDNQGLTGLEHSENSVLGGANGEQDVVHDALGRPLRMETVSPASVGEDVQTTIDAAIQGKTEEALSQAAQHYGAKGATAIVMNPNTGEVLAMANWPGFNPEDLQNATPEELENRATGFTYEPGSTFKAFTVASALQDHVVTPSSSFYLPSEIHVYDRTIGEAEPRPPETLTTAQILAQSSNVGAVTIGLKEGADRFSQWINRFGFGQPTGVGYPGEERGIVPARDNYSGSTMGNLPIGQGLAVTPMQMATAYSAIADGGILRRPTLVKSVGGHPADENTDPHRVITPRTSAQLRRMLEGVLEPGRHRLVRERPRLRPGGQDGNRPEGRERHLLGQPVRRLLRRLRTRRSGRSCWWRWSSTSPSTSTPAAPSRRRSSGRSPRSRCPTSGSGLDPEVPVNLVGRSCPRRCSPAGDQS